MASLPASKSLVDKAGQALSSEIFPSAEAWLEYEDVFDQYRAIHLKPLTEVTLQLQSWLREYGVKYSLAQRLKRKPQILRKLKRFRTRLTQLQDIGGCRIIVEKNVDIDHLSDYIARQTESSEIEISKGHDYRDKGREDSGYRALHLVLKNAGVSIELQLRSKIQHYWAESIERTSVIYGHYLKEQEGDSLVIDYFKNLSNIFYDLEAGRKTSSRDRIRLIKEREVAEEIIRKSDKGRVLDSYENEGLIRTLLERQERQSRSFNNWLLVFDWTTGTFVTCDIASLDPAAATQAYREAEEFYTADAGFEVVMIGASDIATVRETHSHYFGVPSNSEVLESLDKSIVGFTQKLDIDVGAREILLRLHTRRVWGNRAITEAVIKNHLCRQVMTFDSSLATLMDKDLVIKAPMGDGLLLNMKRKAEIDSYIDA